MLQGKCKHVDTTLGDTRLYDGTMAAHYYRAMGEIEERLELARNPRAPPTHIGQLPTLVEALPAGTLEFAW